MTDGTGSHGHGASPIGAWLEEHWDHAVHAATGEIGHLGRHQDPSLTGDDTAAIPAHLTTMEEPEMPLAADLKNLAARIETIGEETVTKVEEISATPGGKAILDAAHAVIVSAVPGASTDLAVVESVLRAFIPAQPPAQATAEELRQPLGVVPVDPRVQSAQ